MSRMGPPIRRRYVTRARTLQSDRAFRSEVEGRRAAWNSAYPAYAFPDHGQPPLTLPDHEVFYPPRLPLWPTEDMPLAARDTAFRAGGDWMQHLWDLCLAFWPPEYYPNYGYDGAHPAMRFAAASLLWGPKAITPQDGITPFNLRPRPAVRSPHFPLLPPEAEYWRTRYEALRGWLSLLASDGGAARLGHKASAIIRCAMEEVDRANDAVAQAAYEQAMRQRGRGDYAVPLLPGITTSDWEAAEAEVVRVAAGYSDEPNQWTIHDTPVRKHAAKLYAAGHSQLGIARLLGIHRRTVERWLEKPLA
jgi:hypothetical protein